MLVFGFPLLFMPILSKQLFGIARPDGPEWLIATIFVLLWVTNAYLWGHLLAYIISKAGGSSAPVKAAEKNGEAR
jgi:hypothetical protein